MVDLHVHSTFSDGTLTPTELISQAEEAGLSALALCDHNTVAGLPEFLDAARGRAIEAVPGVEFSTEYEGTELHILGLFPAPEHYTAITELLNEALKRKELSNRQLIDGLNSTGMHLDYDEISAGNPGGFVNRAVIAAEMVRLGYVSSVKEAFSKWLSEKHGYYHPAKRLDSFETIRFIHSIGCVAVLAHPFLNLQEAPLRQFLSRAVKEGLNAMETCYSEFDEETTLLAKQITGEFGLLESGGSDFHGDNKPHIRLGIGKGNLAIPECFLVNLKEQVCFNQKTENI